MIDKAAEQEHKDKDKEVKKRMLPQIKAKFQGTFKEKMSNRVNFNDNQSIDSKTPRTQQTMAFGA